MRFGIPSRPVPVTEHARIRAESDEMPDVALEKARRRLEELEARASTIDVRVRVQTGNGDEYSGPERRQ